MQLIPVGAPRSSAFVTIGADGTLTNERALTGTANQITVTDNGAGSTVVLSTPQNLHMAATPTFAGVTANGNITSNGSSLISQNATFTGGNIADGLVLAQTTSAGYARIANGMDTKAVNNKGGHIDFDYAGREISQYPGTSAGFSKLIAENEASHSSGVDINKLTQTLFAKNDPTNGYFNTIYRFGHYDGTNYATNYELGSEGYWTVGGGYAASSGLGNAFYLWDFTTSKNILWYDTTLADDTFYIGSGVPGALGGTALAVHGKYITTQASGTIAGALLAGQFTKNTGAGETYPVVQIKPVFNFGASNVSTVNLLDIDSTNTSVTGLTANLAKFSYGGTQRMTLTSGGNLGIGTGTTAPAAKLEVISDATSSNNQIRNVHSTDTGQGAAIKLVKSRGTSTQLYRAQAGDALGGVNVGGYVNNTDNTTTGSETGNTGQFVFVAQDTYTTSAMGTRFGINTVPPGMTASGLGVRFVVGAGKALTDGSATDILSATCANNSTAGGIIDYTIEATDGTDYQAESGQVIYTVVNKAGTLTTTITEVNSQQAVSAGTLTTTWAITAANPAVISVNANTSLSASAGYPRMMFNVQNHARQALTVA